MGNALSTTITVGNVREEEGSSDLSLSGPNPEEEAQEERDAVVLGFEEDDDGDDTEEEEEEEISNVEDDDGDENDEEEEKEVIEVYLRHRSDTSVEQQIRQLRLQHDEFLEQIRDIRIELAEVRAQYEEEMAELRKQLREMEKKRKENDIFLLKVVVVGLLTGALLGFLKRK